MKCLHCGKEFTPPQYRPNQKYCSRRCSGIAGAQHWSRTLKEKSAANVKPTPEKSLADWCKEAAECNLDYGTYRGLIEQGHSFDELKAQNRPPQIHARRTTHHSFSTGDFI